LRAGLPASYTMTRNLKRIPTSLQLTALESPSRSEVDAIELLTLLVERYEQEHYSIPAADPASVVRFLIEQQNLTQRDLIPQFGSESAVSMFLSGQRNLTIEQVRRLSARFKLPLMFSSQREPWEQGPKSNKTPPHVYEASVRYYPDLAASRLKAPVPPILRDTMVTGAVTFARTSTVSSAKI